MGGISAGTAALIAGGVGAAGSVGGALISSQGQKQAAQASQQAAQTEQQAQQTQLNLAGPFITQGQTAQNELWGEIQTPTNPNATLGVMPALNNPDISQMPGYKFTRQQGLLATQNAAAAQGLGVSGNALAAAGQYATNLATQNYQQYFNDFWANQQNRFNMLAGLTSMGANAAVGAGSNISATAGGQATAQIAAGQSQASAANALGSGLAGAGTTAANATLTNALLANQTGSTIGANPGVASGNYTYANPANVGNADTLY